MATLLSLALALATNVLGQQGTQVVQTNQQARTVSPGTPDSKLVESMNEKGLEISFPPYSNSVFGATNPVRLALAKHGFGLFLPESNKYQDNLNDPPVPEVDQKFNGQRSTWAVASYPVLTYNMQAFHVRGGQFIMGPGILRTSWNPSGPEATRVLQLAYYQSLFKDRVEVKGGWLQNDLEFEAFAIAGTFATGALGVYAVIPYQVGQNTTPYGTPGVNITLHLPQHFYDKLGFQRSASSSGGASEVTRDQTGFRFDPHGDGLVIINEAGYKKVAAPNTKQTWIRAGYLHNNTNFTNVRTKAVEDDNWAFYGLADQQLTQSSAAAPRRGLYAGFTTMYAPPALDSSTQYDEGRLYDIGLVPHRPNDLTSVVFSHTGFSPDYNRNTTRAGGTAFANSNSVSASYSARLRPGITFAPGFSYTDHPARTPRLDAAFNIVGSLIFFF
jgi:porin